MGCGSSSLSCPGQPRAPAGTVEPPQVRQQEPLAPAPRARARLPLKDRAAPAEGTPGARERAPGSRPAARNCQLEPPAEEFPPTSRERAPSAKRPSAAPPHRGAAAPSRAAGAGPAPSPCAPCERGPGRGRAGPRLPQRIGMRTRAPRPQRPERLGERSLPSASPRSSSAASGPCGGQRNAAGLHHRCGTTPFGEGSSAPLPAIFFLYESTRKKRVSLSSS
ncbi:tropomyosin-1, isoforms 33/34-like [Ammospiza nelsoni]|uniref:tropomyosin-1, isoforms 33/34-like n=1 Tax=Ammospiza nelsoni TaxID=2857394 RepID=UPI00286B1802|nr:tropomyosin-1, isoforms 33/34-like [Ammospiza nelsoni]